LKILLQDLKYGLRIHARSLGITLVAVLTLALGIGASTTVFSVVNAILLKPLPYHDADNVVIVWRVAPAFYGNDDFPWNPKDFRLLSSESSSPFQDVGAFKSDSFNLTGTAEPELIEGMRVSAGFFPSLGVAAMLGRTFSPDEDQPGHELVVVLSHELWRSRFGADGNIISHSIELNGYAYTIIGVMPPGFAFPHANEMPASLPFPREARLWVPMALSAAPRGADELGVVARLHPGITREQAQANMNLFEKKIEDQAPNESGWQCRMRSLERQIVGDTRQPLLLVLGAVGVVLLVACSNVASLLLARSLERTREFTMRAALGARKGRLVQQLLTESILLALAGGTVGILLAMAGVAIVKSLGPSNIPRLEETSLDLKVFVFVLGVTIATGIIFGLVPSFGATRGNLVIKDRQARDSGGVIGGRLRNILLVSQLALALVLVTAAGLLVRTFTYMMRTDPGFSPSRVITFELPLPPLQYSDTDKMSHLYQLVLQQLEALSEVESVGLVSAVPMGSAPDGTVLRIPDHPVVGNQPKPFANYSFASPNYFSTLGTPLLSGRDFKDSDNATALPVTIINNAMAKKYWPGEDPLGKRVGVPMLKFPPRVIIGIVADIKHGSLRESPTPEMYVPYLQNEIKVWPSMQALQYAVRTKTEPTVMEASIRAAVRSVDPNLPVAKVAPLTTLVDASMAQTRFSMDLIGSFAVLALFLAAVGLYGSISYSVAQHTREIGIRLALGAPRKNVFAMVLGQGARIAAIGMAAGYIMALAVNRMITSFLYGVQPTDPLTFAGVSLLLAVIVFVACYIPARRATRVDPMIALRYE
jgi:putative ABC transport system permease protein